MELTEEQKDVMSGAIRSLKANGTTTIGGLAGTGKSVLTRAVVDELRDRGNNVAVAAFTGKAVSVLKRKGVQDARTLHSLMYVPEETQKYDPETKQHRTVIEWHRKESIDADTVVVDEASMVSKDLLRDLQSYGVDTLFVGDYGQLEPVGDNPNLMASPEFILKTIHRQAADNSIIQFAHKMRSGDILKRGVHGADVGVFGRWDMEKYLYSVDQVIVGFNKTRHAINTKIRAHLGRKSVIEVGEKIICLRNNREMGIFNGAIFFVEKIVKQNDRSVIADLRGEDGSKVPGVKLAYVDFESHPEEAMWDYGYAMTCHKSQGSEFGKVLVVEEIWREKWDPLRWRYTAVTRASSKLVYIA